MNLKQKVNGAVYQGAVFAVVLLKGNIVDSTGCKIYLAIILFGLYLQVIVKEKPNRSESYLLPSEQILNINFCLWLFSNKPQQ